jgi:hypothetical protein
LNSLSHLPYSDNVTVSELYQGDVLKWTSDIETLIRTVHPHFLDKTKNPFFLVLTQSCDLAMRSGKCAAPYVTIAPVRRADLVMQRKITELAPRPDIACEVPLLSEKTGSKFREFAARLINNNEQGYFYLEGQSMGTVLGGDYVAILNLSIAIRAAEHYQKCLDAKITQLSDHFQAKLGWLLGQSYSRVGTPDWPAEELKEKIKTLTKTSFHEVPEKIIKKLDPTKDDEIFSVMQIKSIIDKIPKNKDIVASELENLLRKNLVEASIIRKIMRDFSNSSVVKKSIQN